MEGLAAKDIVSTSGAVYHALGRACLLLGRLEEAQRLGDRVVAVRHARTLIAHGHLGLGRLHRRLDHRPRAREHLMTAATMYRDMDMSFWLGQAQAELRG